MLQELDKIIFNKDFNKAIQMPVVQNLSDTDYTIEQLLRAKAAIYSRLSESERLSHEAIEELESMIDRLPLLANSTEETVERCLLRTSISQFFMVVPPEHEK